MPRTITIRHTGDAHGSPWARHYRRHALHRLRERFGPDVQVRWSRGGSSGVSCGPGFERPAEVLAAVAGILALAGSGS